MSAATFSVTSRRLAGTIAYAALTGLVVAAVGLVPLTD